MTFIQPTETGPVKVERRKRLTGKERAELFALRDGTCSICGGKIKATEAWDDEHELPLSLGGSNDWRNRKVAHVKCHKGKSAKETTERAKADRIRLKHTGAFPKAKRPVPKGRGFEKRGER